LRWLTRRRVLVWLGLAAIPAAILGRMWKASADRGGQQPAEPFRIAGNLYYVGANDVTSFLITGPEGHVLIDGGYPGTPPLIMASIAKLGFDIAGVEVLLNSDPHRDHAGGLAVLQQASGARLWASEASAGTIASGGDDPDIFLPLRALVWIGIAGYPAARAVSRSGSITQYSETPARSYRRRLIVSSRRRVPGEPISTTISGTPCACSGVMTSAARSRDTYNRSGSTMSNCENTTS